MDYRKGYVYELMDQGGPTDTREPYFQEAVEEMIRARTLCAKANAAMPDDPSYVGYLEELFDRKLDDVRILTPFICDFGNRVKSGNYCVYGATIPDYPVISTKNNSHMVKQIVWELFNAITSSFLSYYSDRFHLFFISGC